MIPLNALNSFFNARALMLAADGELFPSMRSCFYFYDSKLDNERTTAGPSIFNDAINNQSHPINIILDEQIIWHLDTANPEHTMDWPPAENSHLRFVQHLTDELPEVIFVLTAL